MPRFMQGAVTWYVTDTSTNGTWVNEVRVPKGHTQVIHEGNTLRLSTPPGEVLEYKFVVEHGADQTLSSHSKRKVDDALLGGHAESTKRAAVRAASTSPGSSAAGGAMPGSSHAQAQHRAPPGSSGGWLSRLDNKSKSPPVGSKELSNYEKQIQDLQRKLAAARNEVDATKLQLDAMREQQARQAQEREGLMRDAEKKAQGRSAAITEAMQKELDAASLCATELEVRLADAEARVAAESEARSKAEDMLSAVKAELEAELIVVAQARAAFGDVQAELLQSKQHVTAMRAERDQAEHRRVQEVEIRVKAQEESLSLGKQVAAQKEAKESSQRAVAQLRQELGEALQQGQAEGEAKVAAESEGRSLHKQLHAANRKIELFEEKLQALDTVDAFKRIRAQSFSDAVSQATGDISRLLQHLQVQAGELSMFPDLVVPTVSGQSGGAAVGTGCESTQRAAAPHDLRDQGDRQPARYTSAAAGDVMHPTQPSSGSHGAGPEAKTRPATLFHETQATYDLPFAASGPHFSAGMGYGHLRASGTFGSSLGLSAPSLGGLGEASQPPAGAALQQTQGAGGESSVQAQEVDRETPNEALDGDAAVDAMGLDRAADSDMPLDRAASRASGVRGDDQDSDLTDEDGAREEEGSPRMDLDDEGCRLHPAHRRLPELQTGDAENSQSVSQQQQLQPGRSALLNLSNLHQLASVAVCVSGETKLSQLDGGGEFVGQESVEAPNALGAIDMP